MTSSPRVYKLDLRPGDRVRYIKDGFLSNDPDIGVSLSATQGSIGRVAPDQEPGSLVKEVAEKLAHPGVGNKNDGRVDIYFRHRVRLESIAPVNRPWKFVVNKVGDTYFEFADSLEKLHPLTSEMDLILDHVRQILPEDGAYYRSQVDQRLLVIEFHIENHADQDLDSKVRPLAWLTPTGQPGMTSAIFAVPMIQGSALVKGQVIFEIPPDQQQFRFKFELTGVGSVETDLYLQNFSPGDAVRLKGTTYAAWYDYFLASRPYDEYPFVDPFFIPSHETITGGSEGVIVPFARFRAAYIRHLHRLGPELVAENLAAIETACTRVKREMEEGIAYPVEITHLTPIPDSPAFDKWERKQICRRTGEIVVINALALEKHSAALKPILAIHWVRIVLPGDDHPLRPEPGNRRLLVDFSFDRPGSHEPVHTEPVELWLSVHPAAGAESALNPVHIEIYPSDACEPEISGQVAVDLPAGASAFMLHLKESGGAEWTQSIALPAFLPGDRIRMTRKIYGEYGSKPAHLAGDRGRILSYAEFLASLSRRGKRLDEDQRIYVERWLALEKPDHVSEFEIDLEYPVCFIENTSSNPGHEPSQADDQIQWISANYLETLH